MNRDTRMGFEFAKKRDFKCFCCRNRPPKVHFNYDRSGLFCEDCYILVQISAVLILYLTVVFICASLPH